MYRSLWKFFSCIDHLSANFVYHIHWVVSRYMICSNVNYHWFYTGVTMIFLKGSKLLIYVSNFWSTCQIIYSLYFIAVSYCWRVYIFLILPRNISNWNCSLFLLPVFFGRLTRFLGLPVFTNDEPRPSVVCKAVYNSPQLLNRNICFLKWFHLFPNFLCLFC